MRKRSMIWGVVLIGVCGLALQGMHAQADTVSAPTTEGRVQFLPSDGDDNHTVDPEPPTGGGGGEVTPVEPGGGGGGTSTKGPLHFRYVPMISFGQNKLSNKTIDYFAEYQKVKLADGSEQYRPNFFDVEDLRGGTQGWSVSLSNDGVFKSGGADPVQATIAVSKISLQSNNNQPKNRYPEILIPTDSYVDLTKGETVPLISASASKKQGFGDWSVRFGTYKDAENKDRNPAIKLTVPSGQIIETKKSYVTTLIWTLGSEA